MKKMTLEQFREQFNIKLNNQQLKAVQSVQNPTLLLAVPGSGKTTVSRGLMALLIKKGLKVQPFKCGPDYIDTKYHTAVCRRPSINLDTFMASAGHVKELYARYATGADACITEGMMGMYDGYDRDRGSSAEVAGLLNLPVILPDTAILLIHE